MTDSDYTIIDYLTEHYPEIITDPNFPADPDQVREWLDDNYYERELKVHKRAGGDVYPDPEKAASESLDSVERAIRANRGIINSYRE